MNANRVLLAHHLRSAGCISTRHTTARRRWTNGWGRPAVLWLDMRMPVLSGQEVMRQVRAHPAGARQDCRRHCQRLRGGITRRCWRSVTSSCPSPIAARLSLHWWSALHLPRRLPARPCPAADCPAAGPQTTPGATPCLAAPTAQRHRRHQRPGRESSATTGIACLRRRQATVLAEIKTGSQRVSATLADLGQWINAIAPPSHRRAR